MRYLPLALAAACGVAAASCGSRTDVDIDACMEEASNAIADEDYGRGQLICDDLFAMVSGADSVRFTEMQAGGLGILYMRLSEHVREEENIADATQCVRYAFRLSNDSLKTFTAVLPLEDVRHFVLLRRIGLSIDNPVDLVDTDMTHTEDSIYTDNTHIH